jgi:hypothetical protein
VVRASAGSREENDRRGYEPSIAAILRPPVPVERRWRIWNRRPAGAILEGVCSEGHSAMRRLLCSALLLFASLNSAAADVRIEGSTGGNALTFLSVFESLRQSGERIVIDGPCFSACTLVFVTIPRNRICVTKRAILGFHAARVVDQNGEQYPAEAARATRVVAASYPAPIRDWIGRHGGLTRKPIFLYGKTLWAMYPLCR